MGLQPNIATPDEAMICVMDADRHLTQPQKAAVIVRLLLNHDVSPGLDRLSPAQQTRLARAMAGLGPISRATLAQVVRDFTGRLDGLALTGPSDLPSALALLDPHLSPVVRDGLKAEADAGDMSDPWTRLTATEPDRLRPILMSESAEVCAILLSKLPVSKAAALLSDIPADRADLISHAVALTATVTPDMVTRIGHELSERLTATAQPAFRASPVDRVGAILNAAGQAARDAVLEGLGARAPAFADDVRRAIFTFAHIPKRVDPRDVPRIMRRADPDMVTQALAAGLNAAPVTVEFLLENMSKRLAEQLRDEAEAAPAPREAEGEAAMATIVTAIRELEETGEIRLLAPDE